MKDTLFDLWNGKITPWSDNFIQGAEERRLYQILGEHREKLKVEIGERESKILEELENVHMELRCLLREEAFVNGFSLGVRMTAESYQNNKVCKN